jgi:tetratricopeptide (TPR) repeat protein
MSPPPPRRWSLCIPKARSGNRRGPRRTHCVLLATGLLILIGIGSAAPALAITAGEARSKSFKLQAEGMRLYREGRYGEAIEAFRQVVGMHLNSFMAWYYLGASLVAERRYAEAIEPLRISLDLQPDYVQGHLALGDAYLKQGETDEARACYLRVLDLQPNYAAAHDGLGRLFESLGKDDEAEAEYRKAIDINVAFADAYTHLGELFLRQGRLDDATGLFLKAIAMKPDFSQAYTRLGVALSRLERFDDAIAAARKSQALSARDPEPYVALARIYTDLQSLRRAQEALDEALRLDPDHVWAHLILADLKRARGDLDAAAGDLKARYERGIDDPRLKRVAYDALRSLLADAERLAILRSAAAARPGDAAPAAEMARFLARQGAHLEAAGILEQAAALPRGGPADPALLFEAASEYLAARREARAIALFDRIAADATGPPGLRTAALFNRGVASAAAGLDAEAARAFRDCLALRPDDAQALLYLGNALLRLGRREEARASYAAYLDRAGSGGEADRVRRLLDDLGPAPAGGA